MCAQIMKVGAKSFYKGTITRQIRIRTHDNKFTTLSAKLTLHQKLFLVWFKVPTGDEINVCKRRNAFDSKVRTALLFGKLTRPVVV